MKNFKNYMLVFMLSTCCIMSSCKKLFNETDIQINPNAVTDVDVKTLLAGTMIGISFLHQDTDVRIASIWAGELNGLFRAHLGYAQYIVSSQTFNWSNLYITASQARLIQTKADVLGDKWTKGVAQVMEALAIAKATALYGDVPYSQAFDNSNFPAPVFDKQVDVYTALQTTLDNAIVNLSAGTGLAFSQQDFFYQGNVGKWKAAAYTLKARLYLHTAQYSLASANAALGIQNVNEDMLVPHGTSVKINTNQNYDFFKVSRIGDTGFEGTFLRNILQSRINSTNTKTNETALYNHFIKLGLTTPTSLDANTTDGAFTADAPHPILTFYETQLIVAEAEARLGNITTALDALNKVRLGLASGYINGKTFSATGRVYNPYVQNDFSVAGIANPTNIGTIQTAMLYEIISQRYIILLMQYESFNDYRRLSSTIPIVQLPITLYAGNSKPQRFIYPQQEISSNPNAPQLPLNQFVKVAVFP